MLRRSNWVRRRSPDERVGTRLRLLGPPSPPAPVYVGGLERLISNFGRRILLFLTQIPSHDLFSRRPQRIKKGPVSGGLDLSANSVSLQILLHFSCRGGSYWLLIVVGSLLLFGREQEFHLLKIVVCVGLPVALIWVCCSFFRLMLKGAASTFAQAQRALSKVAIWYPGWGNRLKLVGCLAVVTVVSFLYFAGLIDIKSVHGFQSALLATP